MGPTSASTPCICAAPSGLRASLGTAFRGLTPTATNCRRFAAPECRVAAPVNRPVTYSHKLAGLPRFLAPISAASVIMTAAAEAWEHARRTLSWWEHVRIGKWN